MNFVAKGIEISFIKWYNKITNSLPLQKMTAFRDINFRFYGKMGEIV